jgi:tetratricopeptide (TPR) repeat protein/DNA-binding XRE family transcriptional regulator
MTKTPRVPLGDRLRRERERRHWTQEELAGRIDGSVPSVSRWENGRASPQPEMLQKLTALFGMPVEAWGTARTRIWTVPYLRNLHFTGRERILTHLHALFSEQNIVAVSQTRAISGLGGIGKTQTALEYAYRYADEYDAVLWVRADAREALLAQVAGLAPLLGLPDRDEADQHLLAKAVKRHLETQAELVWLLIFDNVEDLALVKEFLPTRGNGAVLLTTRLHAVGTHIRKLELDTLTLEEGMQFLQTRLSAGRAQGNEAFSSPERQAAERLCMLLDGLPLALDHAAAYIEERRCSLAEYVARYQQQRATFLQMRNRVDPEDYPDSVATTWLLSFQRVERASPLAADLLRVLAFLHPDAIPATLLLHGAAHLGTHLLAIVEQPALLQQAIDFAQRYSLIRHHPKPDVLSIHRLVQAVMYDGLEETVRRAWRERVMRAVNAVFPQVSPETWPQCERLLPQAVQVARWIEQQQVSGGDAGRLLFETASYLRYRGRYAEAEPLYQRSLHLREQALGAEHPEIATTLNTLGALYREQGKFAEAESLCQHLLRIWEQQAEPDHAQVVESLNTLAVICTSRGQFAEAEPLYLRELAICEQWLGPSHHDTARTLNNLGNLYSFQGRYREAEPLYLRALDIWERQLGPQNSRLAYPLHGLGALYHYQGKLAIAGPLYARALSIREQQLGPEHPQVAYLLTGLANLSQERGEYAEAESLYRRALRIWEEQGEETHPESAGTLAGLAALCARVGRYAEAEPLYLRVQRICEQQGWPEHYLVASASNGLANLRREQRRYADAEPLYQRALGIREKTWGTGHPDTAETMHDLARLREAQGLREEASNWYQRALVAREQVLGAQHPRTRESRRYLGILLRAMGRDDEAARIEAAPTGEDAGTEA